MLLEQFQDAGVETDATALRAGWVAVTPISLDMTSRVDFAALHLLLDK
jgi:broad specificity polyphosphatase/5'/3'-nucleotidase SurE